MATLITAQEVIKETPVRNDFPTAYVNQVKDLVVNQRFCDWLGEDFLDVLLADLKDHSTAVLWSSTGSYSVDDKVIYEGCVFVSLENINTESPVNSTKWAEAEKFGTSEYNSLWKHLKKYLALCVIQQANVYTTFETDSGGTREVFNEDSGRKTATQRTLQYVTTNLQSLESASQQVLKRFIEKADEDSERKAYYKKVVFLDCYTPMSEMRKNNRRWIAYKK
jgi:hypothetical protein